MNAHDLVVSPIPEIASSSKLDLFDLNMTATELVSKVNEASNLVGDEAKVAELVETENDEEEIFEIQAEADGAANYKTEMTIGIVGDVDGVAKTSIVVAPLGVVMEREITDEASYEINYVAAMTKLSSKSPAFASAKKNRREATFVKDYGRLHVVVRHCRQLGCKAVLRHDGYSKHRGGGCVKVWTR